MDPARKHAQNWSEYFEIEALVWETEVRPNEKNGGRFSGEAKGGFLRLWRLLCGGQSALIDVIPSQLAALIGAADAKTGRRLIAAWKAVGLVKQRGQAVKGRYTIEVLDPRDVLIVRRQASDGQISFLEAETEPTSSHAGDSRIGTGAEAPSGDIPPPVPTPSTAPAGGASAGRSAGASAADEPPALQPRARSPGRIVNSENGLERGASAAAHQPAEPPALQPRRISRGGELPRENDLQAWTCREEISSDLRLANRSAPKIFPFGKDQSQEQACAGRSAGASAATAVGELLAQVLGRIDGRRGIAFSAELASIVPGLWGDWADELARELDGDRDAEHGGEPTPLTRREVARLVVSVATRKKALKPPAVHFTGAVNRWLQEHGRRKIFIAPHKPR